MTIRISKKKLNKENNLKIKIYYIEEDINSLEDEDEQYYCEEE